jgi:hypothetical protein
MNHCQHCFEWARHIGRLGDAVSYAFACGRYVVVPA